MNSTKIVAGIVYVALWCACILPNTPVHDQAQVESNDKVLQQIIQKPDEDVVETTCDGYAHVNESIKIEDLSTRQNNEFVNSDDYSPEDYEDY